MGLLDLDKINNTKYSNEKEFYDYLMFEIQSRMVEIDDCKCEKDFDNVKVAAADIAILGKLLAMNEKVNSDVFEERLVEIKNMLK